MPKTIKTTTMAYYIEPKNANDFLAMNPKLPRFQRKKTWKPDQNFKLCISIFKKYPIGVVIVNNTASENWLLDGRQRFEALKLIATNPEEVYQWAIKFIKFKKNDDEDEVRSKFNRAISNYLQNINTPETKSDDSENIITQDDEESELMEELDDSTFSADEQKQNFKILLDLILMVHKYNNNKQSKWERLFDYTKYMTKLPYYIVVNGQNEFSAPDLTKLLTELKNYGEKNKRNNLSIKDYPIISKELFIQYFDLEIDRYKDDKSKIDFHKKVENDWEQIYKSITTINKVSKILSEASLGLIIIHKSSNLDAQNIFELINTSGVKLTAEELLSAKPFWNEKVNNASTQVLDIVKDLYARLGVEREDNDIVRWDLCATLISRLKKDLIVFKKADPSDISATETTLGFKLFSAIQIGGINNKSVSSIELKPFNWETGFETFLNELNTVCEFISGHRYFECMKAWGVTIMSIMSQAVALEFLTVIYKRWKELNEPTTDNSNGKQLKREAIYLLDKMISEYAFNYWRGSSDSKLAKHLKDITDRLKPITKETWLNIINQLVEGKLNNNNVEYKSISPILYHSMFLNQIFPTKLSNNQTYQVDHIYPQDLFNNNDSIDLCMKDSLANLQILSSNTNDSKNNKRLCDITNQAMKEEIAKASNIKIEDFLKYSDIVHFQDLKMERRQFFIETFSYKRDSIIQNNQ